MDKLTWAKLLIIIVLTCISTLFISGLFGNNIHIVFVTQGQYAELQNKVNQLDERIKFIAQVHDNVANILKTKGIIN